MEHIRPIKKDIGMLTRVQLPNDVLGRTERFKNYDPARIRFFEVVEHGVHLYMNEEDRQQAMEEFRSTAQAFQFEAARGLRSEVQAYKAFYYDDHFSMLRFKVNRALFEEDITVNMIERSIVEDCIRYQVYRKVPIQVTVKYIDEQTDRVFLEKTYPKQIKQEKVF